MATAWGYALTIVGAALITTGTIWGIVGPHADEGDKTNHEKMTEAAIIAFPAAGSVALPLGPFMFGKAKEHTKLAAGAAAGASAADPKLACNTALSEWNGNQGPLLDQLSSALASIAKASDQLAKVGESVDGLQAAVSGGDAAAAMTKAQDVSTQTQSFNQIYVALGSQQKSTIAPVVDGTQARIDHLWEPETAKTLRTSSKWVDKPELGAAPTEPKKEGQEQTKDSLETSGQ